MRARISVPVLVATLVLTACGGSSGQSTSGQSTSPPSPQASGLTVMAQWVYSGYQSGSPGASCNAQASQVVVYDGSNTIIGAANEPPGTIITVTPGVHGVYYYLCSAQVDIDVPRSLPVYQVGLGTSARPSLLPQATLVQDNWSIRFCRGGPSPPC